MDVKEEETLLNHKPARLTKLMIQHIFIHFKQQPFHELSLKIELHFRFPNDIFPPSMCSDELDEEDRFFLTFQRCFLLSRDKKLSSSSLSVLSSN
ncbi:hypothetical protein F7725_020369 [Dissostichus mawsoni]|uniref:Uncharacterized protein n=1 Tax=Dissostichus mawsoni TaxID=36200 RepID=A0A7J5YEE4_DISMA|nr:hypothetical protein F7725_020369 [Dissostichus mawsoni]